MIKIYCDATGSAQSLNSSLYPGVSLALFGFSGLKTIKYKTELNGSSNILHEFSNLSRSGITFASGAITDNYGVMRKSLVIASGGKLSGISDACVSENGERRSLGGAYRVYQTSAGKIGVIVCGDITDFDGVRATALCDADVIIRVSDVEEKPIDSVLLRAYAYLFGVPVVSLTSGGVTASDINGEICSHAESGGVIVVPTKRTYKLVTAKKRGVNYL